MSDKLDMVEWMERARFRRTFDGRLVCQLGMSPAQDDLFLVIEWRSRGGIPADAQVEPPTMDDDEVRMRLVAKRGDLPERELAECDEAFLLGDFARRYPGGLDLETLLGLGLIHGVAPGE